MKVLMLKVRGNVCGKLASSATPLRICILDGALQYRKPVLGRALVNIEQPQMIASALRLVLGHHSVLIGVAARMNG